MAKVLGEAAPQEKTSVGAAVIRVTGVASVQRVDPVIEFVVEATLVALGHHLAVEEIVAIGVTMVDRESSGMVSAFFARSAVTVKWIALS